MNTTWKKILIMAVAFGLGFAVAIAIGRKSLFSPESAVVSALPGEVDAADLALFLAAAGKGDYAAMSKDGPDLFSKGVLISDAPDRFKDYESNSFPPYTVYAFYSQGSDEMVRRVLLTLDEDNRVESFIAEEMAVLP